MSSSLEPGLPGYAREVIELFLRDHVAMAGAKGVVVGLSGGIDSALVARLAADALGGEMVLGLSLPDENASPALRKEIAQYAKTIGIRFKEIPILPVEEAIAECLKEEAMDRVSKGNVKARIRMIMLHAVAHTSNLLVAGTGNKSEILLGYFTKYGDGGVDLLPIGDLYKTSVFALSRQMGLPPEILRKPPSAGLWEGQTDEEELGFSYAFADGVLLGVERLMRPQEIAERLGVPLGEVEVVVKRVEKNRHKRRTPPIAKLAHRTVGVDWRD